MMATFKALSAFTSVAVVGHRGSCGTCPENTLPSFASAIEAGADMLEFDVMSTKDHKIVIHHDFLLTSKLHNRIDDAPFIDTPSIRSLTLEQLKEYDCGSKKNPSFPRQKAIPKTSIPTLEEFFQLLLTMKHPNAQKVSLFIEIKRDPKRPDLSIDPEQMAKLLVNLVDKSGLKNRIVYASFDPESLIEIRKLSPKAEIAFLFKPDKADAVEIALGLKANILGPADLFLKDPRQVQDLKKKGFGIIPWTINDPIRWKELMTMGVDGIITDYPEDLARFIRQ